MKSEAQLEGVHVETHAGWIDQRMFLDMAYTEGLITRLPFVYVQYMGRMTGSGDHDTTYDTLIHTVRFRFYVGAQSLRLVQEGQRSAYALLRGVYDAVHGKLPNPSPALSGTFLTSNYTSSTTGFTPQSGFEPAGGMDEQLLLLLRGICIYQTDYTVRMLG
jgi:hypothetical protein